MISSIIFLLLLSLLSPTIIANPLNNPKNAPPNTLAPQAAAYNCPSGSPSSGGSCDSCPKVNGIDAGKTVFVSTIPAYEHGNAMESYAYCNSARQCSCFDGGIDWSTQAKYCLGPCDLCGYGTADGKFNTTLQEGWRYYYCSDAMVTECTCQPTREQLVFPAAPSHYYVSGWGGVHVMQTLINGVYNIDVWIFDASPVPVLIGLKKGIIAQYNQPQQIFGSGESMLPLPMTLTVESGGKITFEYNGAKWYSDHNDPKTDSCDRVAFGNGWQMDCGFTIPPH